MANRKPTKVNGSPNKPKGTMAVPIRRENGSDKEKLEAKRLWWQKVGVVIAFLALLLQVYRWLVPDTAKARPVQPIVVQQNFQTCPVIVNIELNPPRDKR
jgi:hypothetical protein